MMNLSFNHDSIFQKIKLSRLIKKPLQELQSFAAAKNGRKRQKNGRNGAFAAVFWPPDNGLLQTFAAAFFVIKPPEISGQLLRRFFSVGN
jgi:hypothetical protein